MTRYSLPRTLVSYCIGLAAVVIALFFWLSRDVQRNTKPRRAVAATARSQPRVDEAPKPPNVSKLQASELRERFATILARMAREPQPPTEVPEEERIIHGMTPEERRERGFTRMRLFASRSGTRINFLANTLETIGRDDLAARMKGLSKKYAEAHTERDENKTAWGDLLTEQMDLLQDAVRIGMDGETDSKLFRAIVANSVQDVEDAMAGNLESVDRKIEEELSETREKDDVDEVKGGDSEADDGVVEEEGTPETEAGITTKSEER